MRRKQLARLTIFALTLVLLPFIFLREPRAFHKSDLLSIKIRATVIKDEYIDQVVGRLTEYGIRLGIELAEEKLPPLTPRRGIDLNVPETNVKDFLDTVVAKDPRYTWKLEGGVVHVWPKTERDTLVTTLLDTKISHFTFAGGVSRYHIQNEIMNLPEISSLLDFAGVSPLIFISFANQAKLEKGTVFDESNVTLRELLDKLVLKTEIKQWVIMRWGEKSEYITLKSG